MCSVRCTGVHTPEVGPKVEKVCTADGQNTADMKNVVRIFNPDNRIFSAKNNLRSINQTPGLSDKLSRLDMEDDECVCMYACDGHQEGEQEHDECVCTLTC